jgi:hypothetical protein
VHDEVLAYPDVPNHYRALDALEVTPAVINMKLRKGDVTLEFFSAVSFVGRARDITLQNLKVEFFFPADEATERFTRRIASMPRAVAV